MGGLIETERIGIWVCDFRDVIEIVKRQKLDQFRSSVAAGGGGLESEKLLSWGIDLRTGIG